MNKLENPFLKIFCAKFGWNRSGGFVEVGSIYKSTDRQMGTQTDGLTDNDRLKDKKKFSLSFFLLPSSGTIDDLLNMKFHFLD